MKTIKLKKMLHLKIILQFDHAYKEIGRYSTLIDNVEDVYIVMPLYNLLEYSQISSTTSESLWSYYIDKIDDVDDNASDGKPFKNKTEMAGKAPERSPRPGNQKDLNWPPQPAVPTLNVQVTIQLKHISTFLIFLILPLINCEIELHVSWKKDCEHHNIETGVNFRISSTKIYAKVVTLSINDKIKFLENIK